MTGMEIALTSSKSRGDARDFYRPAIFVISKRSVLKLIVKPKFQCFSMVRGEKEGALMFGVGQNP
jgi:hypothetical protein